jgi:hypothetical protein
MYIHHLAQVFGQSPSKLNAGGPRADNDIIQVWPAFILNLIVQMFLEPLDSVKRLNTVRKILIPGIPK